MDFYKGLNVAITVSDKDGNVIYQNDSSIDVNGDARGRNLKQCHNPHSWEMICHMLEANVSNVYTISKKGKKKLIYQTPWYDDDGPSTSKKILPSISGASPSERPKQHSASRSKPSTSTLRR